MRPRAAITVGGHRRRAKALLHACAGRWVIALFLMMATVGNVAADERIPPPEPTAGLGTPTPVAPQDDRSLQELQETAERLGKQRARLLADFGAEQRDGLHYSSSRARHSSDLDDVKRLSQRLREEDQRRSERLKHKLDRIRNLVQSGVPCQTSVPASNVADPVGETLSAEPEQPSNPENDSNPVDGDEPPRPQPPLIPADRLVKDSASSESVASETSLTSKPSDPNLASILANDEEADAMRRAAFALVEEPVDRVRMADNLYGAGEVKLALEVYQNVNQSQLSESSRLWVAYQIANCFHRLGQKMEAERGYRVVTAMSKEGWISQNARWWLDVNDRAKALESQAKQLNEIYQQLQEASNGNAGTP